MRKGYIWLVCILFWGIVIGLICCGAKQVEEPAQAKETVRLIGVELLAADKPQQIGVQHMAGIDTDLIWSLPDVDEPELVSLGEFTITAYCACERCCGKSPDDPLYGITATGTVATEGRTIAADPSVLPYGTVVYIDGQAYTVEDCGGGIKGQRLDIYFDSHEAALEWGVQEREVWVDG